MYRVSNDPRTQRSAQLILEGLSTCLKSKDFHNISVTDIHKASGVSRATFYRLFDIPIDVIQYACDRMSEEFSEIYENIDVTDSFLEVLLQYLTEHYKILEVVYRSRRMDILENAMFQRRIYNNPEDIDNPALEYLNAISCSAIVTLLTVWIRRGKEETPEALLKMFKSFELYPTRIKKAFQK